MMISMISAVAENRVIGNKNMLPWHMPADFKWFKEKTAGKVIVLGYNTFKSLGEKPLPNRTHVILNNNPDFKTPEGCYVVRSIEESIRLAQKIAEEKGHNEIMICGGASVYKQFLSLAHRLYLTEIHHYFEGDTYFPDVNMDEWKEVSRENHDADEKNTYPYSFVILERK